MPCNNYWRKVLAADLGLFNMALFFLSYLPPNTLILPELMVMVGSALCLIGVISHSIVRIHLPGEQWAYWMTGWLGVITFLGFESMSTGSPVVFRVSVGLFLLSGIASAYAAHMIDGGRRGHV